MKSGFINLDYFFLSLLACAFSPVLASVLFVLTYVLEFVRLLDALFYFSQRDPIYAIRFLGQLNKALVVGWASAFVLTCGLSLWLWWVVLPRKGSLRLWRTVVPLGLVLLGLVAADQALGFQIYGPSRHLRLGNHAVDEVLLRVPLSVARPAPATAAVFTGGSASVALLNTAEIVGRHENVLLVVVESMGTLLDADGFAREFSLFQDAEVQKRYSVSQGAVPFFGSTVPGEMRELCHLKTGMYIAADTLNGQQPCLPALYRDAGYQTLAFHGFRATMFQRSDWYPRIGFTGEKFFGDMRPAPACDGAFYGTCDSAVAALLQDRLRSRADSHAPPQFLYWLTLNSHLPVDEKHAPHEACPIVASHPVCAHLAYVQNVLASVKKIAMDPSTGRTTIIVVGDHAPPFLAPKDRQLFDGGQVPFIYFKPR